VAGHATGWTLPARSRCSAQRQPDLSEVGDAGLVGLIEAAAREFEPEITAATLLEDEQSEMQKLSCLTLAIRRNQKTKKKQVTCPCSRDWHTNIKGEETVSTRRILHLGCGDGVRRPCSGPARVRLLVALPAVAAAAAGAAAFSSAAAAPSPASAVSGIHTVAVTSASQATKLKTTKIGGATVLTNGKGFTVYWFGPDTPAKSNCNGACAQSWPPVKGPATAPGVKGKFGTIKRADGSVQATYNGHPLYTFAGDTAPGQAKGNGLNAFGGLWHEVTTSHAASHSGSSGSGGGYGY
jgi:predicted lipoprotein with Yx(FWY)xxD motif